MAQQLHQPQPARHAAEQVEEAAAAGWQLPAPETRRGLVVRSVVGCFSLMLGTPLLMTTVLWLSFVVFIDSRSGNVPAILFGLTGLVMSISEIVAGIRVLKGSPSPHLAYVVALLLQVLFTLTTVIVLLIASDHAGGASIVPLALILSFPMLIPLVRLAPLFIRSSGILLGSRDLGPGVPVRPVPLVLWAPMTTLFASPVLVLSALGTIALMVKSWANPPQDSHEIAAAISAFAVLSFLACVGVVVSSLAMVRRSGWAVAVGGLSGGVGTLVSATVLGLLVYALIVEDGVDPDSMMVFAGAIFGMTAVVVPSLSLLIGAFRFRFRRPYYLDAASPGDKLLHVLVPSEPA